MNEEKNDIKKEKKSAPWSYNPGGDAASIVEELMNRESINRTDALNFIISQFKRYDFEQSSSQSQNFTTLQSEMNRISEIFKAVVTGCDNTVENATRQVAESQKQYQDLLISNDQQKKDFAKVKKDLEQEIQRLKKELEGFEGFKDSVESRILDKDEVISTKEAQLTSFTSEIVDLKAKLGSYKDVESEKQELRDEIKRLEDAAAQIVLTHQEDLLDLRTQLQNEYAEKIERIYSAQSEKIETMRTELEERLQSKHDEAIQKLEAKYENREQLLEKKHELAIKRIREEYQKEIDELKAKPKDNKKS